MQRVTFLNKTYSLSIFLMLVCCGTLIAQTEKSTQTKIEELKSSADFKPQDTTYINLIIELANEKIRTNPDSSAVLLKKGYDLSVVTKYPAGESRTLSVYGYLYSEQGDFEKALEYNNRALQIANLYDLDEQKLKALNNKGVDFALQGFEAQALTQYLEALAVANETDNIIMMISLRINIANLYSLNEDYETSLSFLETAYQLSIEHKKEQLVGYTQLNLASKYTQVGSFVKSEQVVEECIAYFEKQNMVDWLSHAYEQKGVLALKKNNVSEALQWYHKSEELCDQINFLLGYTKVYNGLAEAYLRQKNVNTAEKYALKGLEISEKLKIAKTIKKSNSLLSKIYHEKGEYKLAYEYQAAYLDLYEKGSAEKFKKGLGVLRSKIDFENQKNQIISDNNNAVAKQKNYIYFALGALLIVSLILVLIYRTSQLQKKYNKKLQEKQQILIQHEAELSVSNATKDTLFSIIAHDLKGPINSFHDLIKMSADETISKEDYVMLLPCALKNIEGITYMLNNLLVWAQTQMDGIVVKKENLDINNVVKHIISVLNPIAAKKEISIINKTPINSISFSDRNHLNIILRNLISNCIKFTELKGEITISVSEKDNELEVEVADNGIGMDMETQAQLFKARHLKSTYGTDNEKGTGLGLSICKDMVESNGGKIWVTSEQNKGTRIYFTVSKESENKSNV